jgi:hypothetical protein
MRVNQTMIYLFLGGFIVQYWLLPVITCNSYMHVTNHVGKAYLSVINGLCMAFIEVIVHDIQYSKLSISMYAMLGVFIGVFAYLYKKQIYVNDVQYVKQMIELNSDTLLVSNEIVKKTDNYDVAKLAKNAIQSQKDSLTVLTNLVKKL